MLIPTIQPAWLQEKPTKQTKHLMVMVILSNYDRLIKLMSLGLINGKWHEQSLIDWEYAPVMYAEWRNILHALSLSYFRAIEVPIFWLHLVPQEHFFYSSKVSNYTWCSFPRHLIAGLAVSEALCGLLKHLIVICWLQQDWFSISVSWVTLLEYIIAYSTVFFHIVFIQSWKNKCRKIFFLR